jgi:putative ATPase
MTDSPSAQPLADRIRPRNLDEFVGQQHLVGKGKPIRQAIEQDRIYSMVFWGPPGVGKTTLARIIANETERPYFELSAVSAGKKEVQAIVEQIRAGGQRDLFSSGQPTKPRSAVLFLDEIHRFNKAQQDYLLPFVEDGTLTLIGATTENPSFEVNSALLSRSRVFVLEALTPEETRQIVQQGADALGVTLDPSAKEFIADFANGDARQSLNLLESAAGLYATETQALSLEDVKTALQSRSLRYDRGGEEHFNTISAFIKSMRASNVDAALYYMARMVDSGEDPKFIARRMVIFASEDVGNAQPTALVVANEVFRAVETIGLPECQYNLAQGAVYLALAPKDRASGDAYWAALDDVKKLGNLPIPMPLRNAPTKLMKDLGYGKGYEQYTTDDLLPEGLKGRKYYKK